MDVSGDLRTASKFEDCCFIKFLMLSLKLFYLLQSIVLASVGHSHLEGPRKILYGILYFASGSGRETRSALQE